MIPRGGVPMYRESLHLSMWLKSRTTDADSRGRKYTIKRAKTKGVNMVIFWSRSKNVCSVSPAVASALTASECVCSYDSNVTEQICKASSVTQRQAS